ncbi:hypothetical protein ACFVHB_04330 [Kitasatospora sp. NPDC127111]|uniref:hypothetical protein n=1 Tax=Kitasatospora sp. NPDC127111 TaxID=3345363 RepID=UPI00362EF04C
MAEGENGGSGGIGVDTGVLRKSAGHCREIAPAVQAGGKLPEYASGKAGSMLQHQDFELGVALQAASARWARQTVSILRAIELTGRNLDESAAGHSATENGIAQQMRGMGSQFH